MITSKRNLGYNEIIENPFSGANFDLRKVPSKFFVSLNIQLKDISILFFTVTVIAFGKLDNALKGNLKEPNLLKLDL